MKHLYLTVLLCVVALFLGIVPSAAAERKIVQPKECRTSKYTCVLKKTDGVPFFCVRTARQRQQNARKQIRIASSYNCIRRYPVEYEDEKTDQRQNTD